MRSSTSPEGEQAVYTEGKGSQGVQRSFHCCTTQICFAGHGAHSGADITAQLSFRSPFSPSPAAPIPWMAPPLLTISYLSRMPRGIISRRAREHAGVVV